MEKQEDERKRAFDGLPVFVKELIAGGVAGGFAKTGVAPLERVKILFQTRQAEFRSLGLLGSFSKVAKTEGVLGFYRGNGASVARIVPYAALHFMAYEEYRRWIIHYNPSVGRGPVLDLIAGSFAGGTAVLFTYPLDLVRTKLAYQVIDSPKLSVKGLVLPSEQMYKGVLDCFSKTYKEAGIRGLYRGVAPTLYGIFPYSGLKFYFYEELKRRVPEKHKKDITVKLACGSVAGLLGQTFTYPLDVVRRQMQVQRFSASSMKGTIDTLIMIVQRDGWKHLFSGLSLNYIKVVPSVAIGFTVYDVMKSYLRVPSRDEAVLEAVVTNRTHSQASSLHS